MSASHGFYHSTWGNIETKIKMFQALLLLSEYVDKSMLDYCISEYPIKDWKYVKEFLIDKDLIQKKRHVKEINVDSTIESFEITECGKIFLSRFIEINIPVKTIVYL